MITLREAVYAADQQNGDVESALLALRKHVYGHMNTNLASGNNAIKPPVQLKARYERLTAGESDRVKAQNGQVAAEGDQVCSTQFPAGGYNAPRVECIQNYVAAHAVKDRPVPDSLYKFDFISPRWSFDLAGVSIIFAVIFYTLFAARIILERYMRRRLDI